MVVAVLIPTQFAADHIAVVLVTAVNTCPGKGAAAAVVVTIEVAFCSPDAPFVLMYAARP